MTRTPSSKEPSAPSLSVQFGQALRRYFVTGLATLFPVAVTIWLVFLIFNFVDGQLRNLLGIQIPGLGLVITILVILAVGVFSVHFFGRVLFRTIETGFSWLPIVRKIYPPVKQFAQFLFQEGGKQTTVRGVVLAQYPRQGTYTIAFVTNETQTTVNGAPQTLLTLILPNPPSPFTGPIILVPKEDVIPLDLSVEDVVKFIVSFGVVTPPLKPAQPKLIVKE